MSESSNTREETPPIRSARQLDQQMPATVLVGTLSRTEFNSLAAQDPDNVEESTRTLLARDGPEWFARERDRLRGELEFAYGATLED